jgi:predicted dehydrogenase
MSATEKRSESQSPMRAGVVASGPGAASLIDAVSSSPDFELAAAWGDISDDLLENVQRFDDQRILIVQSGVEAVFISTATRDAVELSRVALEKKIHVWRRPPLARHFDEASRIAPQFDDTPVVYRIASWWEHAGPEVDSALQTNDDFRLGFAEIDTQGPAPPSDSWMASKPDAGGGSLLLGAYPLVEAIVALRGMPDTVFGTIGRLRRRAREHLRETEDTCSATLRHAEGGITSIRATWDMPPYGRRLKLHGLDSTISIIDNRLTLEPVEGPVERDVVLDLRFPDHDIALFARQIRDGQRTGKETLDRHLATLAVIQTIYLSASTGQPETPRKLYELRRWQERR